VAADVHYMASGGARAAAVVSTDAADLVWSMAGHYRMPDALRRVDTLARNGSPVNGPVNGPPVNARPTYLVRHDGLCRYS
jgi:hypothetical protein